MEDGSELSDTQGPQYSEEGQAMAKPSNGRQAHSHPPFNNLAVADPDRLGGCQLRHADHLSEHHQLPWAWRTSRGILDPVDRHPPPVQHMLAVITRQACSEQMEGTSPAGTTQHPSSPLKSAPSWNSRRSSSTQVTRVVGPWVMPATIPVCGSSPVDRGRQERGRVIARRMSSP